MNRTIWPVRTQCRVLEVSTSAYYAWRRRPISAQARDDAALLGRPAHGPDRARLGPARAAALLAPCVQE